MSRSASSPEQVDQLRENEHKRSLEQSAHSAQLTEMFEGSDVEYLREMVNTELDPGTVTVLDNYISPDFVLSYQREEDLQEFKWQLRIKVERVFDMHPPMGGVEGKERAYYYDDPKDVLSPLRAQQRDVIWSYADGIWWRARRSHDGFQQDKFGETTSRVETVDNKQQNGQGKIRGLLG